MIKICDFMVRKSHTQSGVVKKMDFKKKTGKSKMGQTWNPFFWTPSFSRNGARRLRNDPGFRSTSPFSPGHTQNDHPAGDRLNSSCIAKKRHVCWSKHDKIIQNLGSFCLPFIPLLWSQWWDIQDRYTGELVMDNPIPMTSGCAAVSRRHWRSEHCWSEMLRRYQARETSEVDMSFWDGKKRKKGRLCQNTSFVLFAHGCSWCCFGMWF